MIEIITSIVHDNSMPDCTLLSIKQPIICFSYLFLCIALFMTLVSVASFTVLCRLFVNTIGKRRFLWQHLSNFIMLLFVCSCFNSSSTCVF